MRVRVGSARPEQPGGDARGPGHPSGLQSGAVLSPEQAIALQRTAGNAAVTGIQQWLLRVSKHAQSATLDTVPEESERGRPSG